VNVDGKYEFKLNAERIWYLCRHFSVNPNDWSSGLSR
jgi:hypothetical protein